MGAVASIWLAIGLALFIAGAVAVVALCRMALRQGAEVEGEIKAPSLRLRFHARPPSPDAHVEHQRSGRGARGEVSAARTSRLDET